MSHTFEIEVKSLLGSKENADALRRKLLAKSPSPKLVGQGKQRNHYFNAPESLAVLSGLSVLLPKEKLPAFEKILAEGKNVSIRTRDADGIVTFIIKASVGDDTSANGVKRIEFEAQVHKTLEELDEILRNIGLTYQAKWSREREEYAVRDFHITIDKNAGYGYLAEFEKVINDESGADAARRELDALMVELGCVELPQDRLERMFKFYNEHWPEYYGTDKVFLIE
ncbi:MAG: CYTH domain-containing protein [bacterium]|nr:CYTH domain-containing protein [bacterium]